MIAVEHRIQFTLDRMTLEWLGNRLIQMGRQTMRSYLFSCATERFAGVIRIGAIITKEYRVTLLRSSLNGI